MKSMVVVCSMKQRRAPRQDAQDHAALREKLEAKGYAILGN